MTGAVAALTTLLERASLVDAPSVAGDELVEWGLEDMAMLESAGVLRQGAAATTAPCPECGDHWEMVVYEEWDDGVHAFIPCPAAGRVELDLDDLNRWSFIPEAVAKMLAGVERVPEQVSDGCWVIGTIGQGTRHCDLVLAWREPERWPFASPLILWAGPSPMPVVEVGQAVPLSRVLTFAGAFSLDQVYLRSLIPPSADGPYVFRKRGEFWQVRFDSEESFFADRRGMEHIHWLFGHPDCDVHVLDLVPLAETTSEQRVSALRDEGLLAQRRGDTGVPLIEPDQHDEILRQLRDLKEAIVEATDERERDRLEQEKDDVMKWLGTMVDKKGRPRLQGDGGERARMSVQRTIKDARAALRAQLPALDDHLEQALKTGFTCRYRSDPTINWVLT